MSRLQLSTMTGWVGHGLDKISTFDNTERENGGKSAAEKTRRRIANSTFVYDTTNPNDLNQDSLDQTNQLTTQDI